MNHKFQWQKAAHCRIGDEVQIPANACKDFGAVYLMHASLQAAVEKR